MWESGGVTVEVAEDVDGVHLCDEDRLVRVSFGVLDGLLMGGERWVDVRVRW